MDQSEDGVGPEMEEEEAAALKVVRMVAEVVDRPSATET